MIIPNHHFAEEKPKFESGQITECNISNDSRQLSKVANDSKMSEFVFVNTTFEQSDQIPVRVLRILNTTH